MRCNKNARDESYCASSLTCWQCDIHLQIDVLQFAISTNRLDWIIYSVHPVIHISYDRRNKKDQTSLPLLLHVLVCTEQTVFSYYNNNNKKCQPILPRTNFYSINHNLSDILHKWNIPYKYSSSHVLRSNSVTSYRNILQQWIFQFLFPIHLYHINC
jgi:hypothetical protein